MVVVFDGEDTKKNGNWNRNALDSEDVTEKKDGQIVIVVVVDGEDITEKEDEEKRLS